MLCLAGCAAVPAGHPATSLLDRGDRLVAQGDFAAAVTVYEELLARYPDDAVAPRARASRDAAARILAARQEIDQEVSRLRAELAVRDDELTRMKQDLTARESEVARLQRELATRQAELQRLTAEAERLRGDLEQLKRLDLKLERRR